MVYPFLQKHIETFFDNIFCDIPYSLKTYNAVGYTDTFASFQEMDWPAHSRDTFQAQGVHDISLHLLMRAVFKHLPGPSPVIFIYVTEAKKTNL